MTIEFQCACGQAIAVPDVMGGKKGKCPRCGNILDVPVASGEGGPPVFLGVAIPSGAAPPIPPDPPAPSTTYPPQPSASPTPPPPPTPAEEKDCPVCGERIKAAAIKCRFCGEFLGAIRPAPTGTALNEPAFGGLPREVAEAANLSLVLGILGLTLCPVCAPFAIWKGNEARSLARLNSYEAPGSANAGLVLGWIGSLLGIASVIGIVIFVVVLASGP